MNTSASQFCSFLFIQCFLPMQNAVAIRAKGDTFGNNFLHCPGIRSIPNQAANRSFIRTNDVVKIKGGRMSEPAKHTFLGFFELGPQFAVCNPISCGAGLVLCFIFLIPTPISLGVFDASNFGVFIRHLVFR